MNLLGILRKFGDRVGIIELGPESPRLDAPVKIQTRAVTLSELATKIQIAGVGKLAELPAELSVSFEDIYRAAGIHPTSTGWTVERLYEFLNSDAIRAMDRPTAQQEALRVLAAEKVDAADLIKDAVRSEEHTSELQSQSNLVCRLLLEKKTNMHSGESPLTRKIGKIIINFRLSHLFFKPPGSSSLTRLVTMLFHMRTCAPHCPDRIPYP